MKNIWKDFERENCLFSDNELPNINVLEEEFWNYYIGKYRENFEAACLTLEQYILSRRSLMKRAEKEIERKFTPIFSNEANWIIGCRDYLKHLVYTSARGYLMEILLFKILSESTGLHATESTVNDERMGIDGYLVSDRTYPISLKPATWRGNSLSPIYAPRIVKYQRVCNDLVYVFDSGEDILNLIKETDFELFRILRVA